MAQAKNYIVKSAWAYFAPDGEVQVRTIAGSKKTAREMLPHKYGDYTYKEYEQHGYFLKKVGVSIIVLTK